MGKDALKTEDWEIMLVALQEWSQRVSEWPDGGGIGLLGLSEHQERVKGLITVAARNAGACKDCLTLSSEWDAGDYVMLKDPVWNRVCDDPEDLICLPCIETRLGRPVGIEDLTSAPINKAWLCTRGGDGGE